MRLFANAGYDMPSLEKTQSDEARLRAMDIDICFAELKDDLLDSSDPFVQTAIAEMENRFGITKDDMTKCFFAAIRSPQPSETVDICFSYNFNKEASVHVFLCDSISAFHFRDRRLHKGIGGFQQVILELGKTHVDIHGTKPGCIALRFLKRGHIITGIREQAHKMLTVFYALLHKISPLRLLINVIPAAVIPTALGVFRPEIVIVMEAVAHFAGG